MTYNPLFDAEHTPMEILKSQGLDAGIGAVFAAVRSGLVVDLIPVDTFRVELFDGLSTFSLLTELGDDGATLVAVSRDGVEVDQIGILPEHAEYYDGSTTWVDVTDVKGIGPNFFYKDGIFTLNLTFPIPPIK